MKTNDERLTEVAHEDLLQHMMVYGNHLSTRHADALRMVLQYFTEIATGLRKGRHAFPLGTSTGKTQSIISWCYGVHALDLPYTILIAQEQIDTLSDLYRDILDRGVPADKVGIIHTDTTAELPCSTGSPWDYQILLITHEMVKVTSDLDQYMVTADPTSFNALMCADDNKRSVVAWDESLIKSDSRHMVGSFLQGAIGWLEKATSGVFAVKTSDDLKEAIAYLQESLKIVSKSHSKKSGRVPALPERDSETIARYKRALSLRMGKEVKMHLITFLENSQESLRVVDLHRGDSGEGLITYDLRIPASLDNVVILDASAVIRELQEMDSSIEIVTGYEDIKSHENLHVVQIKCRGGNTYVRNMRRDSPVIKEVVNDVTSGWLPEGEAVIITAAKGRANRLSPLDKIKEAIKKAGVNVDETILVPVPHINGPTTFEPMPKFVFLPWGREKATNKYRYCSRMIAVGVLRRDLLELSAAAAGQHEDLTHDIVTNTSDVERIQTSEQFYRVQQWLGRGTARKTTNGVCAPCYAKVYDQADFSPYLEPGLPGVDWQVQDHGLYVKQIKKGYGRQKDTKRSRLVATIKDYISHMDPKKVSVHCIKQGLGLQHAGGDSEFSAALNQVLKDIPWQREGRSIVPAI